MDKIVEEILTTLPGRIGEKLAGCSFENLQEIRFRAGRPAMLYYSDRKSYLYNSASGEIHGAFIPESSDISEIVSNFCRNSVYAYWEEIKEGFITLPGGHRVGIGGRAVRSGGEITGISDFSAVNIRIAREYKDSARPCLKYIVKDKRILNTVIISPPGVGKTTLLRDITRLLASSYKVTVIDERFEIAAEEAGKPQFDIGAEADVLSGFTKSAGITHALRSLSPDVIVCDEIGIDSDRVAIESILKGGCKIITSMHGYSIKEAVAKKPELMKLFDVAVLLFKDKGKPEVKECINLQEL